MEILSILRAFQIFCSIFNRSRKTMGQRYTINQFFNALFCFLAFLPYFFCFSLTVYPISPVKYQPEIKTFIFLNLYSPAFYAYAANKDLTG